MSPCEYGKQRLSLAFGAHQRERELECNMGVIISQSVESLVEGHIVCLHLFILSKSVWERVANLGQQFALIILFKYIETQMYLMEH